MNVQDFTRLTSSASPHVSQLPPSSANKCASSACYSAGRSSRGRARHDSSEEKWDSFLPALAPASHSTDAGGRFRYLWSGRDYGDCHHARDTITPQNGGLIAFHTHELRHILTFSPLSFCPAVLLKLAVERLAINPEQFRGFFLFAFSELQCKQRVFALEFPRSVGGARRRGASHMWLAPRQMSGKIMRSNLFSLTEHKSAFDHIFQLGHSPARDS